MAECVEFYVACNPPLLPKGTAEIIRHMRECEGVIEILYEPHIGWFKCIAFPEAKESIITGIQSNLLTIAAEEAKPVNIEESTGGDLSIISSDPRIIPWALYKKEGRDAFSISDDHVFPDPICNDKYKSTWTRLESHPKLNYEKILHICNSLLGPRSTPLDTDSFAAMMKCNISYNIRQTVLYIGSSESQKMVDNAVAKLDELLHICTTIRRVEHQVVLENKSGRNLAYNWFSKLGFHRSTYLAYNSQSTSHDCGDLMTVAALRAIHLNAHGHWVPERRPAALPSAYLASSELDTSHIRNFNYKTKLATKPSTLIPAKLLVFGEGAGAVPSEVPGLISPHRADTGVPPHETDDSGSRTLAMSDRCDGGLKTDPTANAIPIYEDLLGDFEPQVNFAPLTDSNHDSNERNKENIPVSQTVGVKDKLGNDEDLISFEVVPEDEDIPYQVEKPASVVEDCLIFFDTEPEFEAIVRGEEFHQPAESLLDLMDAPASEDYSLVEPETPTREEDEYPRVQPENHSSSDNHCISASRQFLAKSLEALRLMPGRVSIRLLFGRILLKDVHQSYVDTQQTLQYTLPEVSNHLKGFTSQRVGFSPILSSEAEDIYRLIRITPRGADGWDLFESKVYYDLHCSFGPHEMDGAVVEIDSDGGAVCRSHRVECFALYLHHPGREWDLKLAGHQHYDLTVPQQSWIENWLQSAKLTQLTRAGLRFEFRDRAGKEATVKGIVIRHVFVYRQPDCRADLTVTFSRRLNKTDVGAQAAVDFRAPVTWQTPRNRQTARATPDEWVEASLGCAVVDDMLDSRGGDKAGREEGDYKEEVDGLVEMAGHASDMVAQMDGVGRDNDNGQHLDAKAAVLVERVSDRGRGRSDQVELW